MPNSHLVGFNPAQDDAGGVAVGKWKMATQVAIFPTDGFLNTKA